MYWFSGTTTFGQMLSNLINIEKGYNKILLKYDNLFPYENLAIKFRYLPAAWQLTIFGQDQYIGCFWVFLPNVNKKVMYEQIEHWFTL